METAYLNNFDKPLWESIIEFDPPENNIWQVGVPHKWPFSVFSAPNAMLFS